MGITCRVQQQPKVLSLNRDARSEQYRWTLELIVMPGILNPSGHSGIQAKGTYQDTTLQYRRNTPLVPPPLAVGICLCARNPQHSHLKRRIQWN